MPCQECEHLVCLQLNTAQGRFESAVLGTNTVAAAKATAPAHKRRVTQQVSTGLLRSSSLHLHAQAGHVASAEITVTDACHTNQQQ